MEELVLNTQMVRIPLPLTLKLTPLTFCLPFFFLFLPSPLCCSLEHTPSHTPLICSLIFSSIWTRSHCSIHSQSSLQLAYQPPTAVEFTSILARRDKKLVPLSVWNISFKYTCGVWWVSVCKPGLRFQGFIACMMLIGPMWEEFLVSGNSAQFLLYLQISPSQPLQSQYYPQETNTPAQNP